MLPCPLIVRAHSRLHLGAPPSSTLQRSNVPTFKRSNDSVLLTSLLPYLTIALSSCPDPVGVNARYCLNSFSCNTYGPPRKCCKQKTYGLAKPFRCNTYKKHGVGVPVMVNQESDKDSWPERPLGAKDLSSDSKIDLSRPWVLFHGSRNTDHASPACPDPVGVTSHRSAPVFSGQPHLLFWKVKMKASPPPQPPNAQRKRKTTS